MSEHAPSLAPDPVYTAQIDVHPECATIRLGGHVEGIDCHDVEALIELACQARPRRVVVDLNDAVAIDAAVVGAIVAHRRRLPDTTVKIDVSRIPGPRLLAMIDELLDPARSAGP